MIYAHVYAAAAYLRVASARIHKHSNSRARARAQIHGSPIIWLIKFHFGNVGWHNCWKSNDGTWWTLFVSYLLLSYYLNVFHLIWGFVGNNTRRELRQIVGEILIVFFTLVTFTSIHIYTNGIKMVFIFYIYSLKGWKLEKLLWRILLVQT